MIKLIGLILLVFKTLCGANEDCHLTDGRKTNNCQCSNTDIMSCKIERFHNSDKTYYINVSKIVADAFNSQFEMSKKPSDALELYVYLDTLTVTEMGEGFVHSLNNYLNNDGQNIETVHISFSNLPNLDSFKLYRQISQVCGTNSEDRVFKVKLDNIFKVSQSFFELDSFTSCASSIEVLNMPTPLRTDGFLNLMNVENFTMENTELFYEINSVYLSPKVNNINWEISTNFFPEFYQTEKVEKFYTNLNLTGNEKATFLHKEVFFYTSSVNLFHLSEYIVRIEYGAFSLPGKFKQFFCQEVSANCNSTEKETFFLDGNCHLLDQKLCEICFMHQYGFHRMYDKLAKRCARKEPIQNLMQKCFWREIQPIPESMTNLPIEKLWLDTEIKTCRAFPFDIAIFLRVIEVASQSPQEAPTTISSIPTQKQHVVTGTPLSTQTFFGYSKAFVSPNFVPEPKMPSFRSGFSNPKSGNYLPLPCCCNGTKANQYRVKYEQKTSACELILKDLQISTFDEDLELCSEFVNSGCKSFRANFSNLAIKRFGGLLDEIARVTVNSEEVKIYLEDLPNLEPGEKEKMEKELNRGKNDYKIVDLSPNNII